MLDFLLSVSVFWVLGLGFGLRFLGNGLWG